MQKIFIFGNEDLEMDSLPLRMLPELKQKFPQIKFEVVDPNEEWHLPSHCRSCRGAPPSLADIVAIDTVVGIKDITVFDSLDKFSAPPRVGMHDFDALTNLRLLLKLGEIKSVKIIAIPSEVTESEALEKIGEKINTILADSAN